MKSHNSRATLTAILIVPSIAATVCSRGSADERSPDDAIIPFTIAVEEHVLTDVSRRLEQTRLPNHIDGSGWEYGVDADYMRDLLAYWRDEYDWRKHEQMLNGFSQFSTKMDGHKIHFIHQRSKHKSAKPLVLVHGWPGSFVEFYKVIPMLTEPEKYGGTSEDAFHVVCPSLLGFGFSDPPNERGWNANRMAEVIAKLMSRLGYDRYGAQGGDWGAGIVRWLATNDGGHCIGSHSNFPLAGRPAEDSMRDVTTVELSRFNRRRKELAEQKAYFSIQATRPSTLGYGLNDSPAGTAAWIVDKFWAWSDHRGNLDNSFTKDELLTNVMIYWTTESMPSSVRIYYESQHNLPRPKSMTPFERTGNPAPLGFALFPKEIEIPPRAWVKRQVGDQMTHWTEMPSGGHFAALESPQLLVEDVRKFFRELR